MLKVNVSVPHQISQDEALRRIQARVAEIKAQYSDQVTDLSENWNRYIGTLSGSARGFKASGNLAVAPSIVTVEIALPFPAVFLMGKIEAGIRDELTRLLA
jgi:hypothetical protein